jgi:putative transposase
MLFVLSLLVGLLARLLVFPNVDDGTKDLEILVLRHQLRVLRVRPAAPSSPQATGSCSVQSAVRSPDSGGYRRFSSRRRRCCAGHRTLVRRRWTYGKERAPGRPSIDPQIVELVLRMASENSVGLRADLR